MTGAQRSHKPAPTRQSLDWQEHAACVGHDPNMFTNPRLAIWGLKVCQSCTVATQCATSRRPGAEGIYGGKAHYPLPRRPRQ